MQTVGHFCLKYQCTWLHSDDSQIMSLGQTIKKGHIVYMKFLCPAESFSSNINHGGSTKEEMVVFQLELICWKH